MTGNGSGDGSAIFSTQNILIAVTIFNLVLFVGGTILANLKVDSIQEKYDKAIETVNRAEAKFLDIEDSTLLRIGEITRDVEEKKEKGLKVIETVVNQVEQQKGKIEAAKKKLKTLTGDLAVLDKELKDLKEETGKKIAVVKKYTLADVTEKPVDKTGIPIIFLIMSSIVIIGVLILFFIIRGSRKGARRGKGA